MHNIMSLDVPDPITFVVDPAYLDRPNIYPRQATLLKIIFLREDLFTQFDYDVVEEWEQNFAATGNNGVNPKLLERMRWLKAEGYHWFREVLLVMGRRAGKGYIGALAMAYVLWNYMAKGDPQGYYGIDRDKKLAAFVFAGKKDQAVKNLWGDLNNVILGGPCFSKYVSKPLGESLSVYAPNDFARMDLLKDRGIETAADRATFLIEPKESTMMAGRGPASFCQAYDEMAHVVPAVAKASAEAVYGSATPSLDQFGKDAFILEPSSPWQMLGQFYENWLHSIEMDESGNPEYPQLLMVQLTSWDIYEDWERAPLLSLLPEGFLGDLGEYAPDAEVPKLPPAFSVLRGAIQTYDREMQKLEQANPDTFKVERRSHWAAALDAYLNADKVAKIFQPWLGRRPEEGRPILQQEQVGLLSRSYKAHGDPSKVNANFGFALAHIEIGMDGVKHVVFDKVHHWDPADFPDHIVIYQEIEDWIFDEVIVPFMPDEVTFDQFNSVATLQSLTRRAHAKSLPKRTVAYEKTATHANNWSRYEQFKAAINLELVHAPEYTQAQAELTFLQEANNKVEKQTSGPVQTKDVADSMCEVVSYLIGDQIDKMVFEALGNTRPGAAMQQENIPFGRGQDDQVFEQLGGGSRRLPSQQGTPARRPGRLR
jgi:hypothetical protein